MSNLSLGSISERSKSIMAQKASSINSGSEHETILENKISELRIDVQNKELERALNKLDMLSLENSQLKLRVADLTNQLSKGLRSFQIGDASKIYESIISDQARDINELTQTRNQLLLVIQDMDNCSMQSAQIMKESFEETHKLQMKLKKVTKIKEKIENESESKFLSMLTSVKRHVPEQILRQVDESDTAERQIIEIVKLLQQRSKDEVEKKFRIAMTQLEDAISIINRSHNTNMNTKSQTAKIVEFLDSNRPFARSYSIFEPTETKNNLQEISEIINDVDLQKGSTKDLFILYKAAITVNRMLFDKLNVKPAIIHAPSNDQKISRLQDILDEQLKKMDECNDKLLSIVPNSSADFFGNVSKLINEREQKEYEIAKLKKSLNESNSQIQMLTIQCKNSKESEYKEQLEQTRNALKAEQLKRAEVTKTIKKQIDDAITIMERQNETEPVAPKIIYDKSAEPKIKALNQKVKSLEDQATGYQNRIHDLENALKEANRQSEKLKEEITRKEIENQTTFEKTKLLQKRIFELNEKQSSLIITSKRESDENAQKVRKFQEVMNNANENITALTEEISRLKESKKQAATAIAQHKLEIRSLKLKLEEAEKSSTVKLQTMEAKAIAQKISQQTDLQTVEKRAIEAESKIKEMLANSIIRTGVNVSGGESIEALIKLSESNQKSLREKVALLKRELKDILIQRAQEKPKESAQDIAKERRLLAEERKRAEEISGDAVEWRRWADSIFCRLSERSLATTPASEVREFIESAATSASPQTIRRLEMLRAEKAYLSSPMRYYEAIGRPQKPRLSTLMICAFFVHRIQSLSGYSHPY